MDKSLTVLFAGNARLGVSLCHMSPFHEFLDTAEPADLGPGPRSGLGTEDQLNKRLADQFKTAKTLGSSEQLIRALVLLWHEHLDSAHTLAQSIDNADGAYVHAIMHRREPDYGNSAYWFRRVGRHRCFPELARRVAEMLEATGNRKLQHTLIPRGEWDPFAFVHACEQAANGTFPKEAEHCLREVQRLEFQMLLDSIVAET